jgi:hypothetical protein
VVNSRLSHNVLEKWLYRVVTYVAELYGCSWVHHVAAYVTDVVRKAATLVALGGSELKVR